MRDRAADVASLIGAELRGWVARRSVITGGASSMTSPAPLLAVSRRLIVTRAAELFSSRGYARTTLQEVADSGGCSLDVVHRHFATKSDVLACMVIRGAAKMLRAGRRIISRSGPDPEVAVARLFEAYFKIVVRAGCRHVLRELAGEAIRSRRVAACLAGLELHLVTQVRSLIEKHQRQGILDDSLPSEAAAWVLFSLFMNAFWMYLHREDQTHQTFTQGLHAAIATAFRPWSAW